VIGVINTSSAAKEAVVSLNNIIGEWITCSGTEHTYYVQEVLLLKNNQEDWIRETRDNIPAEQLQREGLYVRIAPKSFQIIRMRLDASSNTLLATKKTLCV
jgi:hypothetical protein